MRILTLSNTPLDASLGSGYVVLGYAAGLRARGHQVDVRGPADYEPLYPLRRAIRYRQALGMLAESVRRLAAADYDVLEFYGAEAWLAIAALARLPGRRFLLVAHSNGIETHCAEAMAEADARKAAAPRRRPRGGPRMPLAERAFRDADALVTVGDFDRNYVLDRGYATQERVLALDNPLPDSYLGLAVDFARPPVIGYCGSWLPRKGAALLASDLPPLLREHPAWRLTLVGVGDSFRAADHFAADLLPRITVVPHVQRDGPLRNLYQSFAIALLPSRYESFGLAAAEAMACGCALAATRTGFAASLLGGEEAMLAAGHHTSALYDAVTPLIENPALREKIARAGHRRVQSLRWAPAVNRLENAYRGWLADLRSAGFGSGSGPW